MTFIDSIRRQLQAMSSLRDLIYEDAYTRTTHPATNDEVACPRCASLDAVRKGHDHDGAQRWLCKDCQRTFRNAADTIITRSKLKPAVWIRYLECFVDCLPLRECAAHCHESLRTSWLMRMRLVESIRRHLPRFHADAGCAVQLDETYLRESFKGNHKRGRFRLPRPAHHRSTPASKRGLSKEQICVVTGVADDGSAFLTMSGRGLLSKNRAIAALDSKLSPGALAITDKATAYPGAMETLGVALTRTEADDHAINRINTLHSLFRGFLNGFRGVSTKRLDEYLTWFLWRCTYA
jgi:transposase-like protein